jgi:hypothetical protein
MHRLAILMALGFLFHPFARAQQKTAAELRAEAAEAEVQRQELLLLERENGHAVQLGNPSFFQRVYGDDFVGTSDQGQVLNKVATIRAVQTTDTRYASVVVSDIIVRFFQDTAVVQSLWSMRGTQGGRSFSRQRRVIHVYVNGGRGWQVVASQSTLLPGEGQ